MHAKAVVQLALGNHGFLRGRGKLHHPIGIVRLGCRYRKRAAKSDQIVGILDHVVAEHFAAERARRQLTVKRQLQSGLEQGQVTLPCSLAKWQGRVHGAA